MAARVLLLVVGLAIGYLLHFSVSSSKFEKLELQLKEANQHASNLEQQLQTFKTHISELTHSGNMSSEDMLAKIMQIFLADLSLRLKPTSFVAEPPIPSMPPPGATAPRFRAEDQSPTSEPPPSTDPSKKEIQQSKTAINREAEKRIANASNESEALDRLKNIRYKNFFDVLSDMKPLDAKTSLILEGNFSGTIQPLDPSQKIISVQMEVNLRNERDKVQGQVRIVESKDGKIFSRTRGEGALKNFSLYESSAMIVVEHNGGDNYFQLYYSAPGDFFVGNDYKKTSVTNFTPVGTVILRRQ